MSRRTSFRDPAGVCFAFQDRIFRFVHSQNVSDFQSFLNSPPAVALIAGRRLIDTKPLGDTELKAQLQERLTSPESAPEKGLFFEHERVFFPSYPYEWPPEMLYAAGLLTLELVQKSFTHGFGLKDATPDNVLFRGTEAVFVDLLSFERRDPRDPVWTAYAQFVRTFLLPLLANKLWGTRLADIFLTHRDGLQPEELYRMCGPSQRLRPPVLGLVSLPVWLSGKARKRSFYEKEHRVEPDKAKFILELLFARAGRSLRRLEPSRCEKSAWSNYMETHSYTEQTFGLKQSFVERALKQFRPKRVLDIGANTGHFSELAAAQGATVVAIDSDESCIGALWKRANGRKLDILPLVVDFSRPSPSIGWRNSECLGFLERAASSFDCVFMLAVLHHLLVTERIPLQEVLEVAAQITTDLLVMEYVDPADEMFKTLSRGRGQLFAGLTRAVFENAAQQWFQVIDSTQIGDSPRWLYLLQKKK